MCYTNIQMKKHVLLALFAFFFAVVPARAATLADLPFGSVIQIIPTDTAMCNNAACTTTTDTVLPLRFVKMQARLANGAALGDETGFSDFASFGDNNIYTYWMFLDNYCWWGNAQCKYNNALSAYYQAYNGVSGTVDSNYSNNISMVMGNTNTGTANANAASLLNNNALNTLDHFYDSLPALVGGQDKADVIPNFTWDMRGNSSANPTAVGWYNGSTRPWQLGTYDPTASNGNDFTFSGLSTDLTTNYPKMTSRLGLVSFTEWQGGTTVYSAYTGQTATNGSGGSFCKARFDTDCTGGGSYNLFNQTGTASNPRPRYPWLRSPISTYANYVWAVNGASGYSLGNSSALSYIGLSPVLWLSSDISTTEGEGSYIDPYCLDPNGCSAVLPSFISITCNSANPNCTTAYVGEGQQIDFTPDEEMLGSADITSNGSGDTFTPDATAIFNSADPVTRTYTPAVPGRRIITATVTDSNNPDMINNSYLSNSIDNLGDYIWVMANQSTVTGDFNHFSAGKTGQFTLTLNGPFVGTLTLSDQLSDNSAAGGSFSVPSCTFALNSYDPVTNTSSCTFDYTTNGDYGAATTVKLLGLPASDYTHAFTPQPLSITVEPLMQIESVSPESGLLFGGTNITITGKGFYPWFNGDPDFAELEQCFAAGEADCASVILGDTAACTNVIVVDSTTITCTTTAHGADLVSVTVNNGLEEDTQTGLFEYVNPTLSMALSSDTVDVNVIPISGGGMGENAVPLTVTVETNNPYGANLYAHTANDKLVCTSNSSKTLASTSRTGDSIVEYPAMAPLDNNSWGAALAVPSILPSRVGWMQISTTESLLFNGDVDFSVHPLQAYIGAKVGMTQAACKYTGTVFFTAKLKGAPVAP